MSEALSLFKQRTVRVLLLVYLVAVPYWLWISLTGQVSSVHNYVWSLIFLGIFPVFAGVSGILLSKKWGFLSAALGRAIFFFSAGVVAWGVGSIIFAYYNLVLGIEVPSPGLADVVYVLSYPFWALGLINLGRGMGAGYKLRTSKGKIAIVLIPIIGLALTYFIFVTIVQGGVFDFKDAGFIKIFLNIFYPLGDFAIITGIGLIYSLSYKMFGGRFKWPINILLIGQFILYAADSGFSYTAIQETFYVANWVDLLFAHALFLLSVGVNALNIQGISSRIKDELIVFAPRASQAINSLVLEIIQGQASIIGLVAWDVATRVPGLKLDVKNNNLSVEGDPKMALEKLVGQYEEFFGNASLEICKDVTRKFLSQLPPEQVPDVLR